MSSDSAENSLLAVHQDAVHVELPAQLGEVGDPADRAGVDGVAVDGPADQGHAGVLADAEHDAVGRRARTDDEHAGRGQGVQEGAQHDAAQR